MSLDKQGMGWWWFELLKAQFKEEEAFFLWSPFQLNWGWFFSQMKCWDIPRENPISFKGYFRWGYKVQWNRAILLNESHKLDPWPLDEDSTSKGGKSRLNLNGLKSIGWNPKEELRRELMIWRAKLHTRVWGQGPTQGFNLLQMSPNWFLGVWTLDPI